MPEIQHLDTDTGQIYKCIFDVVCTSVKLLGLSSGITWAFWAMRPSFGGDQWRKEKVKGGFCRQPRERVCCSS